MENESPPEIQLSSSPMDIDIDIEDSQNQQDKRQFGTTKPQHASRKRTKTKECDDFGLEDSRSPKMRKSTDTVHNEECAWANNIEQGFENLFEKTKTSDEECILLEEITIPKPSVSTEGAGTIENNLNCELKQVGQAKKQINQYENCHQLGIVRKDVTLDSDDDGHGRDQPKSDAPCIKKETIMNSTFSQIEEVIYLDSDEEDEALKTWQSSQVEMEQACKVKSEKPDIDSYDAGDDALSIYSFSDSPSPERPCIDDIERKY